MREKEHIISRLAELHIALQWSTQHATMEVSTALTVGERIMVNQERAALFRELENDAKNFKQSPTVEEKVTGILYLIKRMNWQPKD
ncbi:hypothetical protein GCM10007424_23420 [Flavobacterium suaedae]|uniref:Uncharacterized protein n=1 Tax=Flavobacterium suaedae TaxID=1767027 RepID=A0ABQ1K0G7_9FLAO|nr:hypothetical protein [Flavobacterium suaedae]GGB82704.1 hypothetical protein GCM10007424_23420 [Flavobacterium suaedae]